MKSIQTLFIIGAGAHSQGHHGPAIAGLRHRLPRVYVIALDLASAESYRERFAFDDAFDSLEVALAHAKPDAVVAVTPESMTGKIFPTLLPLGVPLLMEKPFGETVEETAALCELARGHHVMISLNRRFAPVIIKVREILARRFAERRRYHIRSTMLRNRRFDNDFITATAIHLVDTTNFLGGGAAKVVTSQSWGKLDGVPAVSALLRFPDGVTGELFIASRCGRLAETYEIFGENFQIVANHISGEITVWDEGRVVETFSLDENMEPFRSQGSDVEFEAFLDAAESGSEFLARPEDALAAAKILRVLNDKFESDES